MTGTLVTIGIVAGFREFFSGILSEEWVRSDSAIIAALGIRTLAGALGGLLVGAGKDKAGMIGLMTGVTAAAIWAAVQIYGYRQPYRFIDGCGFVILSLVAAGASGLGSRIWPQRTELPKSNLKSRGSSILANAKAEDLEKKRLIPTQWPRVIFAVSITVCSFVAAPMIRNWMAQGQFLDLGGSRNVPTACFQIIVFIALIAAVISGAGTGIGLRHGVYVGLLSGVFCGGIYMARGPQKIPAGVGLVEMLNWSTEKTTIPQTAGALFGVCFIIGTVGGAFGNLLFPPISKRKERRNKPETPQAFSD